MENNKNENLSRLEVLLGKVSDVISRNKPKEEKQAVKLAAEAKKEDGTVVYTDADEFAPGVSVFVKEGEEVVPAPDGEHKLEDGSVVIVADGVVESIAEAEAEEEEMSEEKYVTKTEFAETLQGLYDALSLSAEALAEVHEKGEAQKAKAEELSTQLAKIEKEKKELETKLSKTPATESIKKNKTKKEVTKLSHQDWGKLSVSERIKLRDLNPNLPN